MNIVVDLRSLQSGTISGVENYTLNLLEQLLTMDKQNSYSLFYNSFKESSLPEFNYINAKTFITRWPNKILNLLFKFKLKNLEDLGGSFNVLFMPNLNMVEIPLKAKLALTVHDASFIVFPEFYDLKRKLWHKFLNIRKLLHRADVIFAVSQYTKNDFVRLYNLPQEKVKVIHPGVDLEIFNPDIPLYKLREIRNAYGLPAEFFLFLNTLEPRKNLTDAISAFEKINSDSHLVVAGKRGWKTRSIIGKIKSSTKHGKIHYLGYVEETDKPALLKMARALIYPSFYEGFGFQPLEAMAVGTPVIASQVTALPEVIADAGLLVNPYNQRDLVRAMGDLDRNEVLRNLFVEKGLERVKKFTWEQTAKQTLESLESL